VRPLGRLWWVLAVTPYVGTTKEKALFSIQTLLVFFIVLCAIGLILWGIGQIPGIPPVVKTVIYVIVGVLLLLWLLQMVGGGSFHLFRS
jgi:Flp pilus assembly protein TadB